MVITLRARTMLNVNHEGCVNTLQFECTEFYAVHGQDTRNGSSPARWHSSVNFICLFSITKTSTLFNDLMQVPLLLLAAQPWIRGAAL